MYAHSCRIAAVSMVLWFAGCGAGQSSSNHQDQACTPNGSPSTATAPPNDPGTDCCSQRAYAGMCADQNCTTNGGATTDGTSCCAGNGATAGSPPNQNVLYCNPTPNCVQPGQQPAYDDGTDCCSGEAYDDDDVGNGPTQLIGKCQGVRGLPLPCMTVADCPQPEDAAQACVPASNPSGIISGSWICQENDGANYDGCSPTANIGNYELNYCGAGFDCWAIPGNSEFCTTSCNVDADCGQPGVACCDTGASCKNDVESCNSDGCMDGGSGSCAGACITCGSF
jgi:hypothetical protein